LFVVIDASKEVYFVVEQRPYLGEAVLRTHMSVQARGITACDNEVG
jgi:hypothetical protein